MKSLIAAIVVAVFLAAGSLWHGSYVDRTTEEIIKSTEKVAEAIMKKDFSEAEKSADKLGEVIVREEHLLGVICDHKDYYEIKRAVGELSAYIGLRDEKESLASCAAIKIMTERISEISKPYISNIL